MALLLWVSSPEGIFERHDHLFDTSEADALDYILLTGGERWIKCDGSSLQYTKRDGNDDMGAFEDLSVGRFDLHGRLGGWVLLNRDS
mmetsp:Transcript_7192/g.11919  ORF Transcript_7192/g.11919 Transcript_7192/m.11919 type:complete len:87 (-) Transcript_7192:221-481(-)